MGVSNGDAARDAVIRTEMIADEGLAKRIERENGLGGLLARIAPVLVGLGIVVVAGYRSSPDDHGVRAALIACFVFFTVFVALLVTVFIPSRIRRAHAPGTSLRAEFGPDHISFISGTGRQDIQLSRVSGIVLGRTVIHLREQGNNGERVVLPRELVPPQVARELGQRFGGRRSFFWA
ncbi:hypothetical protein [Gordonia aurantiaca]|uniref:hypothetical protein n=1 Tax=Gordonia sp. B21 TaxID=3151852 RepID=UPI0032669334